MSNSNRFKYVVKYYDDCTNTDRVAKGYVIGCNLSEVAEKISRYYGESSIEEISFVWENDDEVIVVEDVGYEEVEGTNYKDWEGPLPTEIY